MPFPGGVGSKGATLLQLDKSLLLLLFPLRNRFTFSPGLGSVACSFARSPILAFSGFTFNGIVSLREKWGGGGRGRREREGKEEMRRGLSLERPWVS